LSEAIQIPPVELVDVASLKVDGQNPNKMSVKQHKALRESILRYGFIVPIITNKDLLIADGEQRWQEAKTLGMKQVQVIKLPFTIITSNPQLIRGNLEGWKITHIGRGQRVNSRNLAHPYTASSEKRITVSMRYSDAYSAEKQKIQGSSSG